VGGVFLAAYPVGGFSVGAHLRGSSRFSVHRPGRVAAGCCLPFSPELKISVCRNVGTAKLSLFPHADENSSDDSFSPAPFPPFCGASPGSGGAQSVPFSFKSNSKSVKSFSCLSNEGQPSMNPTLVGARSQEPDRSPRGSAGRTSSNVPARTAWPRKAGPANRQRR
jgi:hypothetical protein